MKEFFKYFFAALLAMVVFIILFLLFIGNVFTGKREQVVENRTILAFNLSRPISDKPVSRDFGSLVEDVTGNPSVNPVPLRTVLESLQQAADDRRITALYLRGQVSLDSNYSGWATLSEVRNAILKFKQSGKPVIAYQENLDERTYYLTSTATTSYLYPLGLLELNGLATTLLFFDSTLKRFGIEVQEVRAGKYKSAVEPFTRDTISEESREQLDALLQDVFGVYMAAVSQSQELQPDFLNQLTQTEGILFPQAAVDAKLIDGLRFEDEVITELRTYTGEREPVTPEDVYKKYISLADYHRSISESRRVQKNKVAVIYAEGFITDGYSRDEVSADYLNEQLRKARYDQNVKAVVLRINSPGGSASASDKILREAQLLKAAKPLVVSMGSTAASGGYMIALAGQRLFASANTVTGSIGVYSLIPDISGLLQQQGINVSVVETAPFADAPSIFQPLSEQERAKLQSYIDLLYSSFLQHTAQGRNLTLETVQGLAQGRIWSGQRAQAAGLVGELGGLTEAILAAAELAKLDKYSVIEYQKAQGWEEVVANLLQGSKAVEYLQAASTQDLFTRGREALNKQVKELRFYNDPHGIYARLPYSLVIE